MKLTKYEHACFTLEKDDRLLVVDPGNLTDDIPALDGVVAVVVSHEHSDHFDVTALGAIISRNPEAIIYGPDTVVAQLGDTLPHLAIAPGDEINIGPFNLKFFGGEHLKPFVDSPVVINVAVLINDSVYHASDSFVDPKQSVKTLLLPISGSWMSAQMARDFLYAIKPEVAIPSHDAILSHKGKMQADKYWPAHCERIGTQYVRPTTPMDV